MSRVPAPECCISVKGLDGSWSKLGSNQSRGVVPEGVAWSHELPGGPSTLSFTLKRDTRVAWPDLTPFTPVYATVGGVRAWSGRVAQTPTTRGASSEINVVCQGWWHHLADDPIDKTWVVTDLSRFKDMRAAPGAVLGSGNHYANADINVGSGEISLMNPTGLTLALNDRNGAFLDLGPNNTASRVIVTYTSSNNAANTSLAVGTGTTASPTAVGHAGGGGGVVIANNAGASGTARVTTLTPANARYVLLYLITTTGHVTGANEWFKITSVQVFTDAADESGDASALKASTVISEALTLGADSDVFNTTDTSGVTTTSFNIPEFYTPNRMAITDTIEAVNAYHGYQAYTTPDPTPRLIYRAIPTTPTYVLNDSDGYEFQNASANDSSEIYNRVRLHYTNGDGTPAEVTVTPTTDNTFPGKRGFTRTKIIEVRSKLSSAAATQIAQTYLDSATSAPLKGTVTAKGYITRYTDGARIPVGCLQAGDVLLLGNESDPETGAKGRMGQIAAVTYNHDDLSAQITLDSRKNYLDNLLARIGG